MNRSSPYTLNTPNNFLRTIRHLRHYEEFLLFGELVPFSEQDDILLAEWLLMEYQEEIIGYPGAAPSFDAEAALWAAKIVYVAGQLLIHRKQGSQELAQYFQEFVATHGAGTILSADLTLRFLPDVISNLNAIDTEDFLTGRLEKILEHWHYSGIGMAFKIENPDFSAIISNGCLQQMYADRVITYKNITLASHPAIRPAIMAALGINAEYQWQEFHKNFMK